MTLKVMHCREMDYSTAKCYGSDRIHSPVIRVTDPVPYPTELSPYHRIAFSGNFIYETEDHLYLFDSFNANICPTQRIQIVMGG